jgi:dipeptidyl aminopeptidase/acylaminoacyl peptidase
MTSKERLERDLSAWFAETAGRGTPEFAEDILLETSGIRQRPRWTFVPVLPRPMDRTPRVGLMDLAPGRRLAVVALVVGLLVLGAGAVWVASQPRLPPPFGPAANGLVAYEKGGDIFVVDPATGERTSLVAGPESDSTPRWSLDGTKLAFLRGEGLGHRLVVVDDSGTVEAVSGGDALYDIDPDGIAWAPDGRSVLLKSRFRGDGALWLVDAHTGQPTILPIVPLLLEAYWRPPDGRELLFVGGSHERPGLYLYALADGQITLVPGTSTVLPKDVPFHYRPIGWTPDGSRFAYHRPTGAEEAPKTAVVNVETGDEVVLDVAFGRISNDGSRIVGLGTDDEREWLCIAPTDGGPCEPIPGDVDLVDPTGLASFQWAPDDSWIRSHPGGGNPAVLLSPSGGEVQQPDWAAEGAESWQRRAP